MLTGRKGDSSHHEGIRGGVDVGSQTPSVSPEHVTMAPISLD